MAVKPKKTLRIKLNDEKEEDVDIGYTKSIINILQQESCVAILKRLGLDQFGMKKHGLLIYVVGGMLSSLLLYQLISVDFGYIFHKICGIIIPLFSIASSFYGLALYFRKTWNNTNIYVLFCSCFAGEFFAQCLCASSSYSYITKPSLFFIVLLSVSIASLFSPLETIESVYVIIFISFVRFISCTSLIDLPQSVRPFLAYASGVCGVLVAKYMEATLLPADNGSTSSVLNLGSPDYCDKVPVIRRRRSSAMPAQSFASRVGRRTSLPALIQKQSTSSSYESAIIGEAHGIVSDMLADSNLPPHVVSGLKAISNLLKPPENHVTSHKPKVSPLVSLSEASNYGSDSEDLPYTGERPSSLPKRLRRSLPPSLIRRMSTSTWTTTTSATGLPTLETEPCRNRSSSFRHSRDSTPSASPNGSRSNSPSPNSPTPVSLTIPKSRSFSLANVPSSSNQKRAMRERRSLQNVSSNTPSEGYSPVKDKVSPLAKNELDSLKEFHQGPPAVLTKRFNITSDYESNDSPSSSDHSDHIAGVEDRAVRPTSIASDKDYSSKDSQSEHRAVSTSSSSSTAQKPTSKPAVAPPSVNHHHHPPSTAATPPSNPPGVKVSEHSATTPLVELPTATNSSETLAYDLESYRDQKLLEISALKQWDFPIFDLADQAHTTILSLVTYRLFLETGLFDTFRIPLPEFLNYFHSLELGYREKPYHNRIHATDVLHGVYYLTSQPIPGFQRVNLDGEKQGSSSESESEFERCNHGNSTFTSSEETYGVMGRNLPPLEMMALYTAAAMHDYDHPGRTNAFLVTTNAPLAVLYNDRSVLESHHAASAWQLFLSNPKFNWLRYLDKAEFKRFRFLVIEAILATDLKRHFELLAEFNAKVNDEDAPGIDWTSESDRLMVTNMVIKMADINGPAKRKDLHVRWTDSISEEFYEQGDEEKGLGLPISPYMDRKNPQLAKLQESFINHLVAPLCNALGGAGLLPGTWVNQPEDSQGASGTDQTQVTEDEDTDAESKAERSSQIHCWLTKHLQDNHEMWVKVLKEEVAQKEKEEKEKKKSEGVIEEMEPIKEEDTPPDSANSTCKDGSQGALPSPQTTPQHSAQTTPKHTALNSQSQPTANQTDNSQSETVLQNTDASQENLTSSIHQQAPANQTDNNQSETLLQHRQNQSQTPLNNKDNQTDSLKQTDSISANR